MLVCHLIFPPLSRVPTDERNNAMRYLPLVDKKVGVIEDAKFKRRDALADLAKAATKK
jgi:hypothetical protein